MVLEVLATWRLQYSRMLLVRGISIQFSARGLYTVRAVHQLLRHWAVLLVARSWKEVILVVCCAPHHSVRLHHGRLVGLVIASLRLTLEATCVGHGAVLPRQAIQNRLAVHAATLLIRLVLLLLLLRFELAHDAAGVARWGLAQSSGAATTATVVVVGDIIDVHVVVLQVTPVQWWRSNGAHVAATLLKGWGSHQHAWRPGVALLHGVERLGLSDYLLLLGDHFTGLLGRLLNKILDRHHSLFINFLWRTNHLLVLLWVLLLTCLRIAGLWLQSLVVGLLKQLLIAAVTEGLALSINTVFPVFVHTRRVPQH